MTDQRDDSNGKSIQERIEELFEGMRQALEGLMSPQPALVPVPVRAQRRPYRR